MNLTMLLKSLIRPACSMCLVYLLAVPPAAQCQALATAGHYAKQLSIDPDTPPAAPVRKSKTEARKARMSPFAVHSTAPATPTALSGTKMTFLTLSAGINVVSIPLRTSSQLLSDLFPNLPEGSDVWTWDASSQEFQEGLDQQLPLGQACWLYVPAPTVVPITGEDNVSISMPVQLKHGWNLVGAPYGSSIELARQTVYVNQVKTALPDAVAAGAIGKIYTIEGGRSTLLETADSLEPNHGYWVYSSGDYLLELKPVSLNGGWGDYFNNTVSGWGLKSIGSGMIGGLAGYGVTYLLNSLVGDPVQEKLDKISQQLDQIAFQQQQIQQSIADLALSINMSVEDIKVAVGDAQYIGPVREKLAAHYDSLAPQTSLAWFRSKATVALAPTVSQISKTQFAKNVLDTWDFQSLFRSIKLAIKGTSGTPGVIDTFANKIILDKTSYTLLDRYGAMQSYFAELIGMQIKCAELIGEAYHQLASDPSSGYGASDAADWYNDEFKPAIQEEYQYFGQVVERIAISKLTFASKLTDDPVSVPGEVQAMLGYADFLIMHDLEEQQGLRLHVALPPDVQLPATVRLSRTADGGPGKTITLAADKWRTVNGAQPYDSWNLSNKVRQFRITNAWRVAKVIVPDFGAGVLLHSNITLPADPISTAGGNVTLATYDESYQPSSSGTVFGSLFAAAKTDANTMLDPCLDPSQVVTSTGTPLERCNMLPHPPLSMLNPIPRSWAKMSFTYVGQQNATTSWQTSASYTGCPLSCFSSYTLELLEADRSLQSVTGSAKDPVLGIPSVTWQSGKTYSIKWSQDLAMGSEYLYYRNSLITVPGQQ